MSTKPNPSMVMEVCAGAIPNQLWSDRLTETKIYLEELVESQRELLLEIGRLRNESIPSDTLDRARKALQPFGEQ